MKQTVKQILVLIVAGTVLIGVSTYFVLLSRGTNLLVGTVFKTREANLEYKVFKNTQSYNDGIANDLQRYYEEYQKAKTGDEREAIRQYVLMGTNNYNTDNLQNDVLKQFLNEMRAGNINTKINY